MRAVSYAVLTKESGDAPADQAVCMQTVQVLSDSGLFAHIFISAEKTVCKAIQCGSSLSVLDGQLTPIEAAAAAAGQIPAGEAEQTVLVLHDLQRPFVTKRILQDSIDATIRFGASVAVIPSTDTLFVSRDGKFIDQIPDRKNMYQEQAPQAVRLDVLMQCLRQPAAAGTQDVCAALEQLGLPVHLTAGDAANLRIRSAADLPMTDKAAE